MNTYSRTTRWLVSILFAFVALAPAWAGADGLPRPFDRIVVFGDSLSDPGNAFALTGRNLTPPDYGMQPQDLLIPDFPYARGGNHFSNGPTWIEDVGAALGLAPNVLPALRGASGNASNYAVGGARARVVSDEFHLDLQVDAFLRDVGGRAPSDAVYVIEIGGNDVRDALALGDPGVLTIAVGSIAQHIQILYGAGARKFFIVNAPNIALAPAVRLLAAANPGVPVQAAALQLSAGFNIGLDSALGSLSALPGIQIVRFDLFTEVNRIVTNPGASSLEDVTTACITPDIPPFRCQNPDRHLFWDGIHPTRAGHAIVAALAGKALLSGLSVGD